jgi:hypothetical protein
MTQRSRLDGTAPIKRHADPAGIVLHSRTWNMDSLSPIAPRDNDSPQAVDLATRLRQTRADMLGTDDEDHYWACHEAAAEIQRLRLWGRLTADERRAVREAAEAYESNEDADCERIATTLRGLLERLG